MDLNKDKIIQSWKELPPKYQLIIVSVFSLFFLWFLISPKMKRLDEVKKEEIKVKGNLQQKRIEMVNAQNKVKKLKGYEKKHKELEDKLVLLKNTVMKENELLNLTNVLTFKEDKINYISFASSPVEKKKMFKKLPLTITLETTYIVLGEYIEYIENIKFLIGIDEIVVKEKEDSLNELKVVLKLTAYVTK